MQIIMGYIHTGTDISKITKGGFVRFCKKSPQLYNTHYLAVAFHFSIVRLNNKTRNKTSD